MTQWCAPARLPIQASGCVRPADLTAGPAECPVLWPARRFQGFRQSLSTGRQAARRWVETCVPEMLRHAPARLRTGPRKNQAAWMQTGCTAPQAAVPALPWVTAQTAGRRDALAACLLQPRLAPVYLLEYIHAQAVGLAVVDDMAAGHAHNTRGITLGELDIVDVD